VRSFFGSRRAGKTRDSFRDVHTTRGARVGSSSELYLEDEVAHTKVSLPPPFHGRKCHLFCSSFNAGALALVEELMDSNVLVTQGKRANSLTFTTDVDKLADCDHMIVLLDERTWTSGADTAKFIEHIHMAMRIGVHISCVHEFPSIVGPLRHACDFARMFNDDWTPAHLTGGPTNLYKEVDAALKGLEWRQPGLVALAAKLATSAGEHKPIAVVVPLSYEPKTGANPWIELGGSDGSQAVPPVPSDSRGEEILPQAQPLPGRRGSRRFSRRRSRPDAAAPSPVSELFTRGTSHGFSGEGSRLGNRRNSHKFDEGLPEREVSTPPTQRRASRGGASTLVSSAPERASAIAEASDEGVSSERSNDGAQVAASSAKTVALRHADPPPPQRDPQVPKDEQPSVSMPLVV